MGLNILPKAGIGFKAKSGIGNFKTKLDKLTRYQGGEFGMLRNNRQAIDAAIAKRAETIRIKGGLDRMQRKSALLEIMKNDKSLTKADKYKVKELLQYYSRDKKAPAPAKKPVIDIERDEAEIMPNRPDFSHESNPNFFREQNPLRRGEAVRDSLNYQHMSRLGPGETASKLQKASFAKLQKSSNNLGRPAGLRPPGASGSDLLRSLK